jgi:hypothetical protein
MNDVDAGKARKGRVIGVVKDFHLRSLHHAIEPLVLLVAPQSYYLDNIVVRISSQDISSTLAKLEQQWRELVPNRPFEYFFLDEEFDKLYRREQKLGESFKYFSALAIFVGCLGLFGLASFTAGQRTKEIGPAFPFIILRKGGARCSAPRFPASCFCSPRISPSWCSLPSWPPHRLPIIS